MTFVAVTQIQPEEMARLEEALARHFVDLYGAPSREAALMVARDELAHMADLCSEHDPNTLLTVARELDDDGVREAYRTITARGAEIDLLAVHGSLDD